MSAPRNVIELPDEQAAALKAEAAAQGLTLEDWFRKLAGENAGAPSSGRPAACPPRQISEGSPGE